MANFLILFSPSDPQNASSSSSQVEPTLSPAQLVIQQTKYIVPFVLNSLRHNPQHISSLHTLTNTVPVPIIHACYYIRLRSQQLLQSKRSFFCSLPSALELTPTTFKVTFGILCRRLIDRNLTWGRIVAAFTLANVFAEYIAFKFETDIYENIPHFFQAFFSMNVTSWIVTQGGWQAITQSPASSLSVSSLSEFFEIINFVLILITSTIR